jgi:hypothetical protein
LNQMWGNIYNIYAEFFVLKYLATTDIS